MLEQEYAARGLATDPLIVERHVEMIVTAGKPFGRTRVVGRALKELRDSSAFSAGGVLDRVAGASDEEELAPPDELAWLKPPHAARYEMHRVRAGWARVDLDPAALDWLATIKEADPGKLAGGRDLELWLAGDQGGSPVRDGCTVAVHIGAQRVGTLRGETKTAFNDVMKAARERGENPCTRGRLSVISATVPYLLEIKLPRE